MTDHKDTSLSVVVRELPVVRVACAAYRPGPGQENIGREIRERFERVQAWLQEIGYDPYSRLTIGTIASLEDQLLRYECCIEVTDEMQSVPEDIRIKKLAGGRYAVTTIAKDAQVIPESVRRFHEEYVPESGLKIDPSRLTYEIYYEDVMEYCVPVF